MIILDVNKLGQDFGYGQLFEDVSFSLNEGESISIVGPNGCGKSTFIKSVLGKQDLSVEGNIVVGHSIKIGYLPQIIDFPNDEQQILEYFSHIVGINEERARRILATFQFYKDDVTKKVKNLSGG